RHEDRIDSRFALSPDGKVLASTDASRIVFRDMTGGKVVRTAAGGGRGYYLAFSPESRTLVTGGIGEDLDFWDVATGRRVRQVKGRPRWFLGSLAMTHDGTLLVGSSGQFGTLQLLSWDTANGKLTVLDRGNRGDYATLAFSPDDKLLAFSKEKGIGLY